MGVTHTKAGSATPIRLVGGVGFLIAVGVCVLIKITIDFNQFYFPGSSARREHAQLAIALLFAGYLVTVTIRGNWRPWRRVGKAQGTSNSALHQPAPALREG